MGIDTRMITIKTGEHGTMKAAMIVGSEDGKEAVRLASILLYIPYLKYI